jgi:hypothetical protein
MKTVELLDFCYPDYFSGYPKPVISIPVYGDMTQGEIGEAMLSEINYIYEYLQDGYSDDEIKMFEDYAKGLSDTLDHFEDGISPNYETDVEDEPAYLYFGICEITYSNGMKFLNP